MSDQVISSARINITLANVRSWRSALISDNPFNPRLYYQKQPWQLDLRDTNTYSYQQMLRGEQTRVLGGLFANVINRDDIRSIRTNMAQLQAKSLDTQEEYGISWVVLMTGMVEIRTHRGRSIASPLFIRRIAITPEGMPARDYLITCVNEWDVNRDLLYVLHRDWKLDVDARVLVDTFTQQGWDNALAYFQECLGKLVGVRITHDRFIGVLPDSYLSAAIDIDRKIAFYPRHDLVAAISGSEEAQKAVRRKVRVSIPANLPDRVEARDDLIILDADSSQQQAINTAISGASFVVQGPPGTGKSQTVANMAAALASRGQRVLVTSAKGTSRQDIVRRLKDAGCGRIVADLSSYENITPAINHIFSNLPISAKTGTDSDSSEQDAGNNLFGEGDSNSVHPHLQLVSDDPNTQTTVFAAEDSDDSNVSFADLLQEDRATGSTVDLDLNLHVEVPEEESQALLAEDEPAGPRDQIGTPAPGTTENEIPTVHVTPVSSEPWTTLRQDFINWVETIHHLWQPWNVSYLSAQTALSSLRDIPTLHVSSESASQNDAQQHHQIRALLRTWSEINKQVMVSPIAWDINQILTVEEADEIEHCLIDLHERLIPQARKDRFALFEANVITRTPTIEDWSDLLTLMFELEDFKDLFGEDIFAQDFDLWIARYQAGHKGFLGGLFYRWGSKYRALKKDVLQRYKGEESSFKAIFAELQTGLELKRRWLEKAQSLNPVVPGDKYDVAEVFDSIVAGLKLLDRSTAEWNPWILTHDQLQSDIKILVDNVAALKDIPNLHDIGDKLRQVRVYPMIDAVRAGEISGDDLADVFTKTWLTSVLDYIISKSPKLTEFEIGTQRNQLSQWRRTDVAHINEMAQYIVTGVINRLNQQLHFGKTRNEALKLRPPTKPLNTVQAHRFLNQMLSDAPDVIGALQPIWVASPKQIAEVFPTGEFFDVVIIDEASVMSLEHAVAPLSRARRVIAVGDRHQLPPKHPMWLTMPSGSSQEVKRPESLFRMLRSFLPEVTLEWGHRARDGRIHRVTNPNIYDNSLTVFPSTTTKVPVQIVSGLHHDEIYEHVVAKIIAHITHYPDQSLGVITLNYEQANELRAHFEYKMGRSEGLATAQILGKVTDERLFIKPVDLTQGEERDAIIVVVPSEEETNTFPDLEGPPGFYRLNVALTRARHRVTILTTTTVAQFGEVQSAYAQDSTNAKDRNRETDRACVETSNIANGKHCLRSCPPHNGLDLFAEVLSADYEYHDSEPDQDYRPVINAIITKLRRRLIPVSVAVGTGAGAIDIAVAHPDNPGQMVLAIELDTSRYAHRNTVRDRERLITKALQSRGWRVYRLWLHQWFTDEQTVVNEIETAWRQAVKIVDEQNLKLQAKRAIYDQMVKELAHEHQEEVRKQARERENARRESREKERERAQAQIEEEQYQSEQKRELARIAQERRKEIAGQIQAERKQREALDQEQRDSQDNAQDNAQVGSVESEATPKRYPNPFASLPATENAAVTSTDESECAGKEPNNITSSAPSNTGEASPSDTEVNAESAVATAGDTACAADTTESTSDAEANATDTSTSNAEANATDNDASAKSATETKANAGTSEPAPETKANAGNAKPSAESTSGSDTNATSTESVLGASDTAAESAGQDSADVPSSTVIPAAEGVPIQDKPPITVVEGLAIDRYPKGEIVGLAKWVIRRTPEFSDDEVINVIMEIMGFTRRGKRIMRVLQSKVSEARKEL